ncbi:MAG: hypothetical protein WDM85_01515 [Caulobacteraceae bacterium]
MRGAAAALALAAAVQGTTACAQTVACDVKLNVTDQDPAGLNVRASPGGAVVTALKAKGRWVQVHVTGQSGAWAQIDDATEIDDETGGGEKPLFKAAGWVAFGKLGFEEFNSPAVIRDAPAEGARALLRIEEGDEARRPHGTVLGCSGEFLKVRVGAIVGWTRDYCSNQLTTCV